MVDRATARVALERERHADHDNNAQAAHKQRHRVAWVHGDDVGIDSIAKSQVAQDAHDQVGQARGGDAVADDMVCLACSRVGGFFTQLVDNGKHVLVARVGKHKHGERRQGLAPRHRLPRHHAVRRRVHGPMLHHQAHKIQHGKERHEPQVPKRRQQAQVRERRHQQH